MNKQDRPDFLVVGGGVAGCVAARTLTDLGATVTLLEAGPAKLPAELRTLDWPGKADDSPWLWPTTTAFNLRQNAYLRGRGLGGGSAINGMVADVDGVEFYNTWPEGWRYENLEPFIDGVLQTMGLWKPARGQLSAAIGETTAGESIKALSLFGGANASRRTFADAYLTQSEPGPLAVRSDVTVQRIVYGSAASENQAIGVELDSGELVFSDNVVLCAGTYGTAALLEQSEIELGISEPQDHGSKAITLELSADYRTLEPNTSPLSNKIVGDGFEVLILDHVGSRDEGALMLGETSPGGLDAGVVFIAELAAELKTGAVATRTFESPGGYYHAASTLPGGSAVNRAGSVDGWSRLHIMDASVMPSLVRCSPSVTIAAVAAMLATNLANTS